MGSTASRLEPLRGGSLLFTTKFPEVPGTHSIEPREDERLSSTLEPPSGFEHGTPDWDPAPGMIIFKQL